MKNGFYNIKKLSTEELKQFFTDAVAVSYDSHVEILDCFTSWQRKLTKDFTVQQMIDNASIDTHNVCINRSYQHSGISDNGEIGYSSLTDPDYFLYIFVSLENLYALVEKYGLELIEY